MGEREKKKREKEKKGKKIKKKGSKEGEGARSYPFGLCGCLRKIKRALRALCENVSPKLLKCHYTFGLCGCLRNIESAMRDTSWIYSRFLLMKFSLFCLFVWYLQFRCNVRNVP